MKRLELKVTRIGNSRGVRLPATTLERYQIGERVTMEERSDGILLRPARRTAKLSWEDTAKQMAASREEWSEWDSVSADGLAGIEWSAARAKRVAEKSSKYKAPRRKK